MDALRADVAIIGGGLGACAAALAAARLGHHVILWIEEFGAPASYRAPRNGIRDYYRTHLPRWPRARAVRARVEGIRAEFTMLEQHIAYPLRPSGPELFSDSVGSIGEAAGLLTAFRLDRNVTPGAVRHRPKLLEEFQSLRVRPGIELSWPSLTPV